MTGWRVEAIPGEIVHVGKCLIRIRVKIHGHTRLLNVNPENVLCKGEAAYCKLQAGTDDTG